MSSASASTTKKISRASADGPCLKRGGGLYSMVGAEGVIDRVRLRRRVLSARRLAGHAGGAALPSSTRKGSLVREDAAELVHALEGHARAAHDASQRISRHQHRQAGFFGEQPIEVAQERAAARQHHT